MRAYEKGRHTHSSRSTTMQMKHVTSTAGDKSGATVTEETESDMDSASERAAAEVGHAAQRDTAAEAGP